MKWWHWGGPWPNDGHCPCVLCGWSSAWQCSPPSSSCFFFLLRDESSESLWDSSWWDVSCPLWHGIVCEAGWALEPWESVAGALESFFSRVTLVEPLWLPSPPPLLLGLLSEPAAGFLVMNPMHTFLWLCRAGLSSDVVHHCLGLPRPKGVEVEGGRSLVTSLWDPVGLRRPSNVLELMGRVVLSVQVSSVWTSICLCPTDSADGGGGMAVLARAGNPQRLLLLVRGQLLGTGGLFG